MQQIRAHAAGLAAAIALAASASAQEEEGAVYSVLVENDWFASSDRNYTNGFRASRFDRVDGEGILDGFERHFASRVLGAKPQDTTVAGFALGQNLYTPRDKQDPQPIFDDRPYAAWLYAEYGILARKEKATDRLTLQLGTIGDWALGYEVQNTIHDFYGDEDVEGWPNQIGNTVGFLLSYDRQLAPRALLGEGGIEADISPNLGFTLGNVLISATAGATFRIGFDLPRDMGQARVIPGLGGPGWFQKGAGGGPYLFFGALGRLVGYDITLDGRPFQDDPVTVDSKVGTFDLQAGIAVPVFGQRVALSYVRRGAEFEAQGQAHDFGSLSMAWRF